MEKKTKDFLINLIGSFLSFANRENKRQTEIEFS